MENSIADLDSVSLVDKSPDRRNTGMDKDFSRDNFKEELEQQNQDLQSKTYGKKDFLTNPYDDSRSRKRSQKTDKHSRSFMKVRRSTSHERKDSIFT